MEVLLILLTIYGEYEVKIICKVGPKKVLEGIGCATEQCLDNHFASSRVIFNKLPFNFRHIHAKANS